MELHVVNGLNRRPLRDIVQQIVNMGFNCVRLPFSLHMYAVRPILS